MAVLTLRVHRRLLSEIWAAGSVGLEEAMITFAPGGSVLDVIGGAAGEAGRLAEAVYDAPSRRIKPGIVVVRNDTIVSPHRCSVEEADDGDELLFLPMIDGG